MQHRAIIFLVVAEQRALLIYIRLPGVSSDVAKPEGLHVTNILLLTSLRPRGDGSNSCPYFEYYHERSKIGLRRPSPRRATEPKANKQPHRVPTICPLQIQFLGFSYEHYNRTD